MDKTQPDQLIEGGLPPARAGAGGDGVLRPTGGSKSRGELSFRGGDASSRRIGRPGEKAPSGRNAPPGGRAPYRGGRSHMGHGGVDSSNPAVRRHLDPAVSRQQATVRDSQPSPTGSIRSMSSTRSISLLERHPGEAVLSPSAVDEIPPRRPRSTTAQSARGRSQKCGPRLGSLLCLGRRSASPTPNPTRSSPSPTLDPRRPSNRISSQSLGNATIANPPKGHSDISLITPPRLERPGSSSVRDQTAPGAGCQRENSRAVQPSQTSSEVESSPSYASLDASLDDSIGDQQVVRAQSARSLEVVSLYQGATAPGCAAQAGTTQAETAQAGTFQAGTVETGTIQVDPSWGTAAPDGQLSSATAKKQKSTSRRGFQAAAAPQSGGAGRAIEVTPPAGESPASRTTRSAERVQTRPVPHLPHFPEAPQVGETPEPYRSLTIRTSRKRSSSPKKSKKSTTAQPQAASIVAVGSQSSPRRQRPSAAPSDAASIPLARSQSSLQREQPSVAQAEAAPIILTGSPSSLRRERPSKAQSETASSASPASLRPSSSTSSVAAAEPLSFKRSEGTSVVQSPDASAGCPTSSHIAGQGRGADELRQDRVLDAVQAAKPWAIPDRAPANRIQGSRTRGDGSSRDSDRFSRQSSPSTALRQSPRSGRVTPEMISVTERIRRQEEIIRAQQAGGFTATIGLPNSLATRPFQPSSGFSPDGTQRQFAHPVRPITRSPARCLEF